MKLFNHPYAIFVVACLLFSPFAQASKYVPIAVGDITIIIPINEAPVTQLNEAPVTQRDTLLVNEKIDFCDTSIITDSATCSSTVDVLANDTDPQNDSFSIISRTPVYGTLTHDGESITYTPIHSFYHANLGTDTIEYTIADTEGNEAVGYVDVLVNRAPVARDVELVFEEHEIRCNVINVDGVFCRERYFPDDDIAADEFGFGIEQVVLRGDNYAADLRFRPAFTFFYSVQATSGTRAHIGAEPYPCTFGGDEVLNCNGDESFAEFRLIDAGGAVSQKAKVSIRVQYIDGPPQNQAPEISGLPTSVEIESNETSAVAFAVNDAESTAANLSVLASSNNTAIIQNSPSKLYVSGSGSNRVLHFAAEPSQSGVVTISVTASDGEAQSTETIEVTVSAANTGPLTPEAVQNLSVEGTDLQAGDTATLSWTRASNIIDQGYYRILVTKPGQSETELTAVTAGTLSNYAQSITLDAGEGRYTYRVIACNSASTCGYSSSTSVTTAPTALKRKVTFIHTDLLGSPVAETGEDGNDIP